MKEESIQKVGLMRLSAILTLASLFALTPVLFGAPASAKAAVLYDQTTGVPGPLVASEQSIATSTNDCLKAFFTPLESQDCIAADDFTVPPGPAWNVTGVFADGQGGVGDDFKFEFFKDAGGLPNSPSSPFLGVGGGLGPASGSGDIAFKSEEWGLGFAALPPGTYWFSVYADGLKDEAAATSWYWQSQSPQVGREAAWLKMCGPETERWSPLSACGQPGPDLRFRLEGERMTRAFSKFRLSKPQPKPSGGFTVFGTFPGPGELTMAGVGKSDRETVVAKKKTVVKSTPIPIQINPTPPAKGILLAGGKLAARVEVRFARKAGIRKKAPTYTRKLTVLLDKR